MNENQKFCQHDKPPLGLMPRHIYQLQEAQAMAAMQDQRRIEILEAVRRYAAAGRDIPNAWMVEYLDLSTLSATKSAQTEDREELLRASGGGP